jgi:hypothetical protein
MNVFGIDPSFGNSGVAHLKDGVLVNAWQIATPARLNPLERAEFICTTLATMMAGTDPVISLELPFHQGQMGSMMHMLYISLLRLFKDQKRLVVGFTNSQAHALIPGYEDLKAEIKMKNGGKAKAITSDQFKKLAIAAFKAEHPHVATVKSDAAEAYFLAKNGWLFARLLNKEVGPDDLAPDTREMFLSQAWNDKGKARKGLLYRPWLSYFDYRGESPEPTGTTTPVFKEKTHGS